MHAREVGRLAVFAVLALVTNTRQQGAGDWTLIVDRPIAGKYEDISFPDTTDGWITTATGEIMHSSDGGRSWQVQARGLGVVRSVDFIDRKRGFAGTLAGTLYATIDGGVTWTNITAKLGASPKGFCGITHVGNTVHAVGRYVGGAADYYMSQDGGQTWHYRDLRGLAQGLVDVSFMTPSVGLIGGMAKSSKPNEGGAIILRTTDGGRSWRETYRDTSGRGFVWKFFLVSSRIVYAALQSQDGTYRVAKSTDAGGHWRTLIVATGQARGFGVQAVGFLDANTGWIGGFFRGMYSTADGGETWAYIPLTDGMINRFEKVGKHLFTGGTRGILRYDAGTLRKRN
jgi:photosystem II stability/assembly factor-like uncharacterized protein